MFVDRFCRKPRTFKTLFVFAGFLHVQYYGTAFLGGGLLIFFQFSNFYICVQCRPYFWTFGLYRFVTPAPELLQPTHTVQLLRPKRIINGSLFFSGSFTITDDYFVYYTRTEKYMHCSRVEEVLWCYSNYINKCSVILLKATDPHNDRFNFN